MVLYIKEKEISIMKLKLFNKKINPNCSYCQHSKILYNTIICEHYGVVLDKSYCGKFRYDPLKRVPKEKTHKKSFNPEDFSLDV